MQTYVKPHWISDEDATPTHNYRIPIYTVQLVRDGSISSKTSSTRRQIKSPADAAQLARDYMGDTDREHLVVIMLDTRNTVIGVNTVSIGSLNAAIVLSREVFKPAILANAAAIVMAHNHPSGDPAPSPEDVRLTQTNCTIGKMLAIEVLDHVIIGDGDRFYSMKDAGHCTGYNVPYYGN